MLKLRFNQTSIDSKLMLLIALYALSLLQLRQSLLQQRLSSAQKRVQRANGDTLPAHLPKDPGLRTIRLPNVRGWHRQGWQVQLVVLQRDGNQLQGSGGGDLGAQVLLNQLTG